MPKQDTTPQGGKGNGCRVATFRVIDKHGRVSTGTMHIADPETSDKDFRDEFEKAVAERTGQSGGSANLKDTPVPEAEAADKSSK